VVESTCEGCSGWRTVDSTDQRRTLLAPLGYGIKYQVRVTAYNDRRASPTADPLSFTLTAPPPVACDEGSGEKAPPIDYDAPLLTSLPYNLEVTDKKAIRYTLKGSELNPDGTFKGGAIMYLNFGQPGGIPVRVTFKKVRANQLLQVTEGDFYFVTAKGGMADGDEYFEGDKTGSGKGSAAADLTLDAPLSENATLTVKKGSTEGTLMLTVMQPDGSTKTVEVPAPENLQADENGNPDLTGTTVRDSEGSTFTLQPNGSGGYTPQQVGMQGAPPKAGYTLIQNTVATVTFDVEKAEDRPLLTKYEGSYTSSLLMEERHQKLAYAEVQDGRQHYYAPILSVSPGKSITLKAKLNVEDPGVHPDSLFFATKEGERLTAKRSGDSFTLNVTSGTPKESRRYYALAPIGGGTLVVVGAVEVVTYPEKTVSVALVPVNGFGENISITELETYLNQTYAPANVKFKLTKEESFSYNGNLKLLENKSGLLEAYTDEMKAFNSEYLNHVGENFKKDALYLFFANYGGGSDKFAAGFMPRQQQIGYMFIADADRDLYRTVAHELGHGAANFAHTFDKTKYNIPQESTKNLMDYSDGTELVKLQWDALHNPGEVWKIFESDKDAMWTTDGHYYTVQLVALHMKIPAQEAKKLGKAAEEPDSHVVDDNNMEELDTWLVGGLQQKYHALTGGYHGVELAATAYALTNTHTDDESLNYLMHRFGDCFAHFEIKYDGSLNTSVQLKSYIDAIDKYVAKKFVYVPIGTSISTSSGVKVMGCSIVYHMTSDGTIQTCKEKKVVTKKLISYIIQTQHTRDKSQAMSVGLGAERTVHEAGILAELPTAIQNEYRMYGSSDGSFGCFTIGHQPDGTKPDIIIKRDKLYMFYVAKLIELLSIKYNKKVDGKTIENKISAIVQLAKFLNMDRLDGIFSFEIARLLAKNKKEITFVIPVKYLIDNHIGTKAKAYYYYWKDKPDFNHDAAKMKEYAELYFIQSGISQEYSIKSELKSQEDMEYWEFKLTKK
jgi:hypothetical protein